MSVLLISEDERLKWTKPDADAGFYYRRPPIYVQRDIQAKHTVKGITDNQAVVEDLLAWAILGWFGFVDRHGNVVEYRKDLLDKVPELMKAEFIAELYSLDPVVDDLGN